MRTTLTLAAVLALTLSAGAAFAGDKVGNGSPAIAGHETGNAGPAKPGHEMGNARTGHATGDGLIAAHRCHDAKGKFTKCPAAAAKPATRCRDPRGHYAKCGAPGTHPA